MQGNLSLSTVSFIYRRGISSLGTAFISSILFRNRYQPASEVHFTGGIPSKISQLLCSIMYLQCGTSNIPGKTTGFSAVCCHRFTCSTSSLVEIGMEDLALFLVPQLRLSAHIISIQHSAKFALCNSQLLGKDKENFFVGFFFLVFLDPRKILLSVKALKTIVHFYYQHRFCLYPFQENSKLICVKSFQIFDKNTLL